MAATPGVLYKCPWDYLGTYKHVMFLPLAANAAKVALRGEPALDNLCLQLLILTGLQYILFQLWCTATRLPSISGKFEIQTKGIKFEQVDHEATWENFIFMIAYGLWGASLILPSWFENVPLWNTKGIIIAFLVHAGPVEWIYYWAHRALHHHYLFRRYHSHHHTSFVTEPITSSNHPFIELVFYVLLFSLCIYFPFLLDCGSVALVYIYVLFVDTMNAWGHCNFEFIPPWVFKVFPFLKYLVYTPTFHSLHHTAVHTNFSLFMPLYDHLYGTVDKTTDSLYEFVRKGRDKRVDCVYLTHGTEVLSMFHLQCGFQTFAAEPYSWRWYIWILWPIALPLLGLAWLLGKPFISERHRIGETFEAQTWMIPRLNFQYSLKFENARIEGWIEDCIIEAQEAGAKVIALGLLNKKRQLKCLKSLSVRDKAVTISIVTGETLTAAIVVHEIPEGTKEVFMTAVTSRVGLAVATYLCKRGTKVLALTPSRVEYDVIRGKMSADCAGNLEYVGGRELVKHCKLWIVGDDGLSREQQSWASPGTHVHQFTVFPMQKRRRDCTYWSVPGLKLPKNVQNVHACEDVMPRYMARAGHAAAMVQALEGWSYHDFGEDITVERMEAYWAAALKHGFTPAPSNY